MGGREVEEREERKKRLVGSVASFAAFVAGWVNSVSTTRCRLLNCNHFCFFSLTTFLVFTAVVRTNILSATSFGFIYMSCSIYLRSILANFDKILEKNIAVTIQSNICTINIYFMVDSMKQILYYKYYYFFL